MIRGDIDLTKDLDFYHDNSEKLKDKAVSGYCPWEDVHSTITLSDNSYLISNQIVEYNDPPDVDLDEDTFQRSYLSTSTPSTIQTTYYDDNIVTTISYDDQVYTRDQFTNYYLTYNNFDNSSITILSNSRSNYTNKYTLKWNASAKLDYDSGIDCFGYHKRKSTYTSFPNSDVLDAFEDKPEKYYPKIPWDNNSLSFTFSYFQDYNIHYILPWNNRDRKNESKEYYHGIPWLDKLNRWVREDYIDELDGYEKDNSKFLTDMRWFHTSRNRI